MQDSRGTIENVGAAFFDIDGTLSIPYYKVGEDKFVPGGTVDWWMQYCSEHENPYEYCKTPAALYDALEQLKEQDIPCFVLSTESTVRLPNIRDEKKIFIKENYGEFFPEENIIFTEEDDEKISYLKDYAKKNNVSRGTLLFVDDSFPIICQAVGEGINAHHISEFLETQRIKSHGYIKLTN